MSFYSDIRKQKKFRSFCDGGWRIFSLTATNGGDRVAQWSVHSLPKRAPRVRIHFRAGPAGPPNPNVYPGSTAGKGGECTDLVTTYFSHHMDKII